MLTSKLQEREIALFLEGRVKELSFNKLAVESELGRNLWSQLPGEYRQKLEEQAMAEQTKESAVEQDDEADESESTDQ